MIIITVISLIGSVLIGGFLVQILQSAQNEQFIKILLAFSGGFLLSIGFIHFIPELYEHSSAQIGLFILLGFLIQLILEFFSGGIEHGHIHSLGGKNVIPFAVILALGAHALFEGMPLGNQLAGGDIATSQHHHENDFSLLLGIVFHRIPVAIALMTLLYQRELKPFVSWIILIAFAIISPIGMVIGYYGQNSLEGFDLDIILAIVVGMFLHISTTIIFETSENHKFNFIKLLSILFGFGLAYLLH